MKTQIYNLIILDESGSMSGVKKQTVSGCNETINTIRTAQQQFAETQDHFVSIFAFQSDGPLPSRYLIKNIPVAEVKHITANDYDPYGCTPLYDAIGSTLTDLKAVTADNETALGSVTIITDGMENSSRHYTLSQVSRMIDSLKELGWSFNFIGANIDVAETAKMLNIDNALEFEQDAEGTAEMFAKESRSRMSWLKRAEDAICSCNKMEERVSPEERSELRKKSLKDAAKNYFDETTI